MPRFPRWSTLALPLAVVLVLTAAPGVLAQEDEFDRVAEETAAIRELPLEHEIVEVFLTQEELAERLPGEIAAEYPAEEAEADARAWAAFGLIPDGTDLATLYTDLLTEQVAGYYDPETDEMVVIGSEFGAVEEFTYSHEVVHALQDQRLGLGELIDASAERSDDAALALTSLYEGDAMSASLEYLLEHPTLAARVALAAQPEMPLIDAAPPVLAIWFFFPYVAGQPFVETLRENGGWAAVDAAYADPPVSSEQILHPEKYLARDEPTPVALPDLVPVLGAGWEIVDENVVGELQTAVLLADLEPGQGMNELTGGLDLPEPATNAAAGWDGDWYALWGNGDQEVMVWRSVWDSEEDAEAFSRALRGREEARFGGAFEGETADDVALVTEGNVVRVVRTGAEVTYVLGPTLDLADRTLGAVRAG